MKTQNYFFILTGFFLFSLISCSEDQPIVAKCQLPVEELMENNSIIYPSSKDFKDKSLLTKSNNGLFETDWENVMEIQTAKFGIISLPWGIYSTTSVPKDLVFDIKKEDGWKMVLHTLTNKTDLGLYAVFYNQRTGIMKVFYYAPVNEPNNTATWYLAFTSPQTWLNMGAEVAVPYNLGKLKSWKCSNAVTVENKGVQHGWNCFQVALAYNPNNSGSQYMDINSESLNIGTYNLFGNSFSHSQGTLLTNASDKSIISLTKEIGSIVGEEAESWIQNSVSIESRGIALGTILAVAIKVVGKLTSTLTSKPSIQDLEFTTRGNFSVEGTLTAPVSNSIKSLRASFTEDKVGKLGAWNLADQPVVYMDPRADHDPSIPNTDLNEQTFRLRKPTKYNYTLAINPDLQSHIKDQWVEIDFVRYWQQSSSKNFFPEIPGFYTNFGSLGDLNTGGFSTIFKTNEILYGSLAGGTAIFDFPLTNLTFVARNGYQDLHENNTPVVFIPTVDCYGQKIINLRGVYMRMSLYLVTDFEGKRETTVSSRTFIPKFEWDPILYNQYINKSSYVNNEDVVSGISETYESTMKLIDEHHPGGQVIEVFGE